MLTFFIGILSGFCLALPVGAIALMCINKTLQYGDILRIIGGLCLIFISIRMLFSGPVIIEDKKVNYNEWPKDIISGFVITISNPLTYIGFIALLSYMHLTFKNFNSDLILNFSLGAFVGSMAWWLILVEFARFLKNKVNSTFIRRSNIISGLIILGFGAIVILSSIS